MKGTFIIQIPEKYAISVPDAQGNETNPYFHPVVDRYATNLLKRGWKLRNGNNMLHAEVHDFTVQELLVLTNFEGTVEYFNPFIKVAEGNIDDEIPEGLPNRVYSHQVGVKEEEDLIDEDTGVVHTVEVPDYEDRIHTWRTWRDSTHPLGEPIKGFYYFMSATFGKTLASNELLTIHNSLSAELVDSIPETNGEA